MELSQLNQDFYHFFHQVFKKLCSEAGFIPPLCAYDRFQATAVYNQRTLDISEYILSELLLPSSGKIEKCLVDDLIRGGADATSAMRISQELTKLSKKFSEDILNFATQTSKLESKEVNNL